MPGDLANGTRFTMVKLMQHIIDAEIATGPDKGRRVFIPRLSIIPFDTEMMPFTLRRWQFSLQPAFAMTINKAQGQTLQTVGVYLPKPFFATGSFMWLSLGAAHGGASGCWYGVVAGRLWMGPLLAFTPVMWSIARCCSDSSYGYGVLRGLLWTPSFLQGLGFGFVQGDGLD
jgi:hypothetical protein